MEVAVSPEAVDFLAEVDPAFTDRARVITEGPDMEAIMEVTDLGIGALEDMATVQAAAYSGVFVAA